MMPLLRTILCILAISLLFPCDTFASDVADLRDGLTVRVGIYENPPKVFSGEQGKIIGIYPDILNEIARKEQWNLTFVKGTWEECLSRLKGRSLDVMVDVAYSPDRSKEYDFNDETVFVNWGAIYVRKGLRVESFPDLKNKRVAVMKGSIHTTGEQGILAVMKQFDIPCTFIEVEDYNHVFTLISEGKADAGVVNRLFGTLNELSGSSGTSSNIARTPIIFNPQHLKFAFPKNGDITDFLRQRIDIRLSELKQDPSSVFHRAMNHYFSGLPGGLETPGKVKSSPVISLTPLEKDFIVHHPRVKIAIDPGFAPFEFYSESGDYQGMGADYVDRISKIIGIRFEPVKGIPWDQAVKKAEKKEIDVLPCVGVSEKRKRHFLFSKAYLAFPRVIVTRQDSPLRSVDDLRKKSVAVQINSSHHDFVKEHTSLTPVLYNTFKDALLSVSKGDNDAVIGNLAVTTDSILKYHLTNLKIAAYAEKELSSLSMAVRNDWPELVSLINKALDAIPERDKNRIYQDWVPGYSVISTSGPSAPSVSLNMDEIGFLDKHRTLRVGIDPAYPPFEWRDAQGGHQGISADFLKQLGKKIGVAFEIVPDLSWTEVLDGAKEKKLDIVACVSDTPVRREYLLFTDPYLSFPIVIITRNDSPFISGLNDLNGRDVSLVKDYAPVETLTKQYPAIRLSLTDTPLSSLEQVSIGLSDACIENLAVAVHLMQKNNITNLKVAAPAENLASTSFSIGVRKDMPLLVSILNKALAAIPPDEKNAISGKWLSIRFDHVTDWRRVIRIVGAVIAVSIMILLFFFYWNRRLSKEISIRRKVELELMEAKSVAEKASQAKSIFLANMSHEIRTPMNAILGYAQLLHADTGLNLNQKDSIDTIMKSGEHLLHIINDILEMSRIEAGKLETRPTLFDLHALLHDVDMMIRVRTDAKNLELIIHGIDHVPRYISADEGKLRQILINLLGNAVKFTEKGSVCLSVSSDKPPVMNERLPDHSRILFVEIEDTGPGIPENELKTIFDSFEQSADGRTKEGTGLGLAICRQYLHFLGGDISARNKPDNGCVFSFTFPFVEGRAEDLPEKPSVRRVMTLSPGHNHKRILVVDDKETNRIILSRMLKRVGFEIREASDGSEAVTIFKSWHPHVIMMDIRMPVMDGVEATRIIKNLENERSLDKKTVIIAVSASAMEEERINVLKFGADDFIRKPFKENVILDAIKNHLGITYVYEGDSLSFGDPERHLDSKDISILPEDYGQSIRKAIEGGYHDELIAGIMKIEEIHPAIARRLMKLAHDYDYNSLLSLLNADNPKDPS